MLLLDDLREQFATFLLANAKAKFRMDAALVHVVTLAYEQGLKDGAKLMEHLHSQSELEVAGGVGTEARST